MQRYPRELDRKFQEETEGEYVRLKKRVLKLLVAEIASKTDGSRLRLSQCRAELTVLGSLLGQPLPSDSGEETRRSLLALTDEELRAYRFRGGRR